VHPDHVDMEYVRTLQERNQENYQTNSITGTSLDWRRIAYPSN
jgi:hypothetical protein